VTIPTTFPFSSITSVADRDPDPSFETASLTVAERGIVKGSGSFPRRSDPTLVLGLVTFED
jgi:hypothetical protein